MRPVISVADVRRIDARLAKQGKISHIIERVGESVALGIAAEMGGVAEKRFAVLVGPGNNGRDARATGDALVRLGGTVRELIYGEGVTPESFRDCDGVIDGLFGTGLSRGVSAIPIPEDLPVFAIDIASGLDADTGQAAGGGAVIKASHTFAIGALKPAHLLGLGREATGTLSCLLEEIVSGAVGVHLVEEADLPGAWGVRNRDEHKWSRGLLVVGGSPGMRGAPVFSAAGALAAGAGIVHLFTQATGGEQVGNDVLAPEVVIRPLDGYLVDPVVSGASRFKAGVIGPGIGRSLAVETFVRRLLLDVHIPLVVDADGLGVLASGGRLSRVLKERSAPTVITPHQGEFEELFGEIGTDRLGAARRAAAKTSAVVVLKGNPTVIADPEGRVVISAGGSPRLARAGTGDVLAGVIGAGLAGGLDAFVAAWAGSEIHGRAANDVAAVTSSVQELTGAIARLVGEFTSPLPQSPALTLAE